MMEETLEDVPLPSEIRAEIDDEIKAEIQAERKLSKELGHPSLPPQAEKSIAIRITTRRVAAYRKQQKEEERRNALTDKVGAGVSAIILGRASTSSNSNGPVKTKGWATAPVDPRDISGTIPGAGAPPGASSNGSPGTSAQSSPSTGTPPTRAELEHRRKLEQIEKANALAAAANRARAGDAPEPPAPSRPAPTPPAKAPAPTASNTLAAGLMSAWGHVANLGKGKDTKSASNQQGYTAAGSNANQRQDPSAKRPLFN
eukprot:m.182723 g.182723  ORF g.182723 m.182723 type:complete len:258 (-) comp15613_c0_seq1:190-963(-)